MRRARRSQGFALCFCAGTALQLPSLGPTALDASSQPLPILLPALSPVAELPPLCTPPGARGQQGHCHRAALPGGVCRGRPRWRGHQLLAGAGCSGVLLHAEVLEVFSSGSHCCCDTPQRGQGPSVSPSRVPPSLPSASSPALCLCCSATADPAPPEAPREAPNLSLCFLACLGGSCCFSAALFLPGLHQGLPACSLLPGASLCRAARAVRSISLCWGLPLGSPDVLQFPWLLPPRPLPADLVEIPAEGILQGYF